MRTKPGSRLFLSPIFPTVTLLKISLPHFYLRTNRFLFKLVVKQLHELIFLWFVGHFYVAFTENSIKWIIFEKPVGFHNSLVFFPSEMIYSKTILNDEGLDVWTSNKLWLLSCKARQRGTVGRDWVCLGLHLLGVTSAMILPLWDPEFATVKCKQWPCLLGFSQP
jgi:hypothetical protein